MDDIMSKYNDIGRKHHDGMEKKKFLNARTAFMNCLHEILLLSIPAINTQI